MLLARHLKRTARWKLVAQWLPSRDTSVCQQKVENFVSPKINASILKELSAKLGDSGTQLNLGCEL